MAKAKVSEKYTRGLKESTAAKRKAEIRKRASGKSKSFKPLPGDKKAKTKESKYTKRVKRSGIRKRILERATKLKGSQDDRFVKAVALETGISKSIIDQVFRRGQAAWRVGHRPGATQAQWSRARVYSFLSKGKTTKTGDADLYQKAQKALKAKDKRYSF